jgi:hypothetical protein
MPGQIVRMGIGVNQRQMSRIVPRRREAARNRQRMLGGKQLEFPLGQGRQHHHHGGLIEILNPGGQDPDAHRTDPVLHPGDLLEVGQNGARRRSQPVGHVDKSQIGPGGRITHLAQGGFHRVLPLLGPPVPGPEARQPCVITAHRRHPVPILRAGCTTRMST